MSKQRRVGKSEARAKFLPLVHQVAMGAGPVEITDRGQVTAVLMGHKEYLHLMALAHAQPGPPGSPVGTMEILGDLEEASQELTRSALDAIFKSADSL